MLRSDREGLGVEEEEGRGGVRRIWRIVGREDVEVGG